MESVLAMGALGDDSSGYQFVAVKQDVQVAALRPWHLHFSFTTLSGLRGVRLRRRR